MKAGRVLSAVALALLCVVCYADLDYFFQLTDNHMKADYKVGSDPKKYCVSGKGNAGKYGDYNCRSPYKVEVSAVNHLVYLSGVEKTKKHPLFILYTGDSVAGYHHKQDKAVVTYELKNVTHLLAELQKKFNNKVPIFPLLGNHDVAPSGQFLPYQFWVYNLVADLWKQFLPKSALETLKHHGYYSVDFNQKLRIIALNTILYYKNNNQTETTVDPGGQLAWLRNQLDSAKKANKVVYIAGHIPFGGGFRDRYWKPFLDALAGYHDIIMGSFWGHTHTDLFRLVGNCSNNMDCHVAHIASCLESEGSRNPSFRRYFVDTSSNYLVKDWKTISMDLKQANKEGKITWKTIYNARSAFGINDASPKSILALADKMKSDHSLTQKMRDHLHGGYPMGTCDESCHKELACSVRYSDPAEYSACKK